MHYISPLFFYVLIFLYWFSIDKASCLSIFPSCWRRKWKGKRVARSPENLGRTRPWRPEIFRQWQKYRFGGHCIWNACLLVWVHRRSRGGESHRAYQFASLACMGSKFQARACDQRQPSRSWKTAWLLQTFKREIDVGRKF